MQKLSHYLIILSCECISRSDNFVIDPIYPVHTIIIGVHCIVLLQLSNHFNNNTWLGAIASQARVLQGHKEILNHECITKVSVFNQFSNASYEPITNCKT